MIQPLLQDILKPATAILLKTIDEIMNSNTMLLKGLADHPLTATNDHVFLTTFTKNPLFLGDVS